MAEPTIGKTDIGELVRRLEDNFVNGGGVQSSKYVNTDLYTDINKIYAYLESKHTTGETDSLGREKPFFNICIAARNIWYRATDIDRSNIKIKPTKQGDVVAALLATAKLQDWMRREDFGQFLNNWGMELASFNSAVSKFVEKDGKLHCVVVPWSRLIVDPIDFANNPKIEILELTEAQLYQREGYDEKIVEALCNAKQARKNLDDTQKDQRDDYIRLYEIHADLPLSYLTGKEEDAETYAQQMHVISFVAGKEDGKYDDYTLMSGREAVDPYMLTSLLPATDGSVSLNGSVKNLFEAQWMQNHSAKAIKDQLDIASKLAFQTSDRGFVGKNSLFDFDNGSILVTAVNQPLTQLNNSSHDTTALQNFKSDWKALGNEINGISEAMLGANPPSGSPWRQTEALLQESHSLFELMTENKGLAIERMLRQFVIPYLKKQLDTTEEVSAIFSANDLNKIDKRYIKSRATKEANSRIIKAALENKMTIPQDQQVMMADMSNQVQGQLAELGNQRFFKPSDLDDKTWKAVFKDFEWEAEADITGEASNTRDIMTTLNTALQVLINPAYANNPKAQFVVDKILTQSAVISPAELSSISAPLPTPPTMQSNNQLPANV